MAAHCAGPASRRGRALGRTLIYREAVSFNKISEAGQADQREFADQVDARQSGIAAITAQVSIDSALASSATGRTSLVLRALAVWFTRLIRVPFEKTSLGVEPWEGLEIQSALLAARAAVTTASPSEEFRNKFKLKYRAVAKQVMDMRKMQASSSLDDPKRAAEWEGAVKEFHQKLVELLEVTGEGFARKK